MNGERTAPLEPSKKGLFFKENGAAGAACVVATGRGNLCGRGLRQAKSFLTASDPQKNVAAHPPVDLINLSSDLCWRSLKARLAYSSSKVRARRSCAVPCCPQLRLHHSHRQRATANRHVSRSQKVGANPGWPQRLLLSQLRLCAHVRSEVLERFLVGDNDDDKRKIRASGARGEGREP